jgi:hypothetical protein
MASATARFMSSAIGSINNVGESENRQKNMKIYISRLILAALRVNFSAFYFLSTT